jgi:alanyl-tRNA synthetase
MAIGAGELRSAFTRFFVERGHVAVPSAGLIPHHPRAPLFTNAGMNQFIPYFLGEETPPYSRATTIQRCVRIRGKHDDIELIGRTSRHLTFFEMLGNFSWGDYFKREAIRFAWDLLTGELGLEPERLWVTVHEEDDEAERIWTGEVGVPAGRVQRMGEDNFWEMGETGPCGPCSEVYFDRGEAYGAPGGPSSGGEERFVEVWNLVFTQYDRQQDGSLAPLPRPNIDTGAGMERLLAVLQGVPSVWETDVLRPVIARAESVCGRRYGEDAEADVALRILADHARSAAFLVSDGVFPSNEGRGYVLRRLIRRAVLRARRLGASTLAAPPLVAAVAEVMGEAYPKLAHDRGLVEVVVAHEEEAFLRTLRVGSELLDAELESGSGSLAGEVAFKLHDTYGFPIDLTVELARERGVEVDRAGFDAAMAGQRERARRAARAEEGRGSSAGTWREVLEEFGPTRFVGYEATTAEGRVLAVERRLEGARLRSAEGEAPPAGAELVDVVLDTTPFYPEGGGQVGDTGVIESASGRMRVLDTTRSAEGVVVHAGYLTEGGLEPGEEVGAAVDAARRDAIRRNHTGTHLLHWALREVLGKHVQQQGSLVAPDRLRFDFSHFAALTREELARVDDLVNSAILRDEPVRVYETSKVEAERSGAVAFFGEKYGEVVRVVEAGAASVELCGGTHVHALGMIGPLRIVSESSIGANTRRIEATTGEASLERIRAQEATLELLAARLRTSASELEPTLLRHLERERELEDEARVLRASRVKDEARAVVERFRAARIADRLDGLDAGQLRELALAVRDQDGVEAVAFVGVSGPGRVALVAASRRGSGLDARSLVAEAARAVGGGGGGSEELATAGGRDVGRVEEALALLRSALEAG